MTYDQSKGSAKPSLVLNLPLHHAYCLIGPAQEIFSSLKFFLERDLQIQVVGNPDFWHADFGSFGVEESRGLINRQMLKSAGGGKKIIIVKTPSITWEAQNALLKVFEEPTVGTHFFLVLPSAERLLPTFKSRVVIVPFAGSTAHNSLTEAKKFLSVSLAQKFEISKKIAESKDARLAIDFLDLVERELAHESVVKNQKSLSIVLQAKSYLNDRSPAIKMLLDWVAMETNN